ncbi:hypothetical protein Dimus_017113 [Dionaea muscipula]
MLMLDSSVGENISVLSIVGMGGLGKTTLAQLVFHDDKINKHFERKLWAYVGEVFATKVIIRKILMSAMNRKPEDVEIDQVQSQLGLIDGNKHLLVLDNVWNEDLNKWHELKSLLMGGNIGSKILLTTNSRDD